VGYLVSFRQAPQVCATIDDVSRVLASPRQSFEDLLQCLHVSQSEGRWDLVDEVARRAIGSIGNRSIDNFRVKDVVDLFVRARLEGTRALEELPGRLTTVAAELRNLAGHLAPDVRMTVREVEGLVQELILLLNDGTVPSLVSCSRLLRRFHRPDLAVVAVEQALRRQPENVKALNTRAAAYLDMGELGDAYADLQRSWRRERTMYNANILSRYWGLRGEWDEALRYAHAADELSDGEGEGGLPSILKAAAAKGDSDLLDWAVSELAARRGGGAARGNSDWPMIVAARSLVKDRQLDTAEAIVEDVLARRDYGPAEDLKRQIEGIRKREATRIGGR